MTLKINHELVEQTLEKMFDGLFEGGEGSGFYGHAGRPGYVGGSAARGAVSATEMPGTETPLPPSEPGPVALAYATGEPPTTEEEWDKKFKKAGIIEDAEYNHLVVNFKDKAEMTAALNAVQNVHTDIVNRIPQVEEILTQHPLRYITISGSQNIMEVTGSSDYKNTGGLYQKDYQKITISRGKGKKDWTERRAVVGDANINYSGPGIYRHELGHHVWDHYYGPGKREFIAAYKSMTDQEIHSGISYYAAKKSGNARLVSEGFAEAFSAWTHPGYGTPKKLTKRIELVMEKYFHKIERPT